MAAGPRAWWRSWLTVGSDVEVELDNGTTCLGRVLTIEHVRAPPLVRVICSAMRTLHDNDCSYDIDDDEITVEMELPWRTNDAARGILEKTAAGDGPEAVAAKKELKRVKVAEDNIKLTYEEASRWLRLGYAYTYYSIQGRTIRDRTILLLDSTSKHFTVRNLIVGISRAPRGSQIKIPSVQEEEDFVHGLDEVPDEVDLGAQAEEFQEEDVEEYEGEENEEEEEEEDEEED
jgi:hypothetical protein